MKPLPRIIYGVTKELGAGILVLNDNNQLPVVARVIQYKNYHEMIQQLNAKPPIAHTIIPGYCIALIFSGYIGRGYRLIGGNDVISEIQGILNEMAEWYINNKINQHKTQFKRYEI